MKLCPKHAPFAPIGSDGLCVLCEGERQARLRPRTASAASAIFDGWSYEAHHARKRAKAAREDRDTRALQDWLRRGGTA